MTAPNTFTGKNIETALHKAAVAMGVAADSIKYEVLAGATGGYALIKVVGQTGKPAAAPSGAPLVESLSGDPTAPAQERSERPDRGDRGDRGDRRGPPRDRGGDRGPRPDRGDDRGPRPDRGDDRGPRPDRGDRGGDRGPRPDRGDRGGDRGPRPDRGDRGPRGDRPDRRPRREEEPLPIPVEGPSAVEIVAAPDAPLGPFGEKVKDLLHGLLSRAGLGMKVVLSESEDEVVGDMHSGPYHEALLARDMELLDAIEHLVEKAATGHGALPEGTPRKKLHLDSQGHRAKADVELAQAARHMAERAIAEQRTMKLGPLEPRARRVVHLTLREMTAVVTKSEGEGVFRRVCIIPKSVAAAEAAESTGAAEDQPEEIGGEG